MKLVDRIVARRIAQRGDGDRPRALGPDRLESPRAYGGWLLPIRLAATVRYFRLKREVLSRYALSRRFPATDAGFSGDLRELAVSRAGAPGTAQAPRLGWWSVLLRAWVFYPAVVLLVVAGALTYAEHRERQQLHWAMSVAIPNYADAVHTRTRLNMETMAGSSKSPRALRRRIEETSARIDDLRAEIVAALPDDGGVADAADRALSAMADERAKDETIRARFAELGDALRQSDMPYAVEPHIRRASCTTLLPGSFESRAFALAMSRRAGSPGIGPDQGCRVTLLLPYHVRERATYESGGGAHRVALMYRADTMPVRETVLGLTYPDDRGSQVYLDRIRRYTLRNVVPALEPDGAEAMFPVWVTLTPEAEELSARAVRTSLENVYDDDLSSLEEQARAVLDEDGRLAEARVAQSMRSMGKRERRDRSWDDLGLEALSSAASLAGEPQPVRPMPPLPVPELQRLEARLAHVVTRHELEHQMDRGALGPKWSDAPFGPAVSRAAVLRAAEETAGYLRGLIEGDGVRHLLLAQLAAFVTNPLAKLGAERHASRAILVAMDDCRGGGEPDPRVRASEPAMEAFATLVRDAQDEALGEHARCAYEGLFGREPAALQPR